VVDVCLFLSKVIDDDLRYHSWPINFRPAVVGRLKKKHASDIMFIPKLRRPTCKTS
jgi:hypothetical protein